MAHLALEQRCKIETYLSLGKAFPEIGEFIGKDKLVISSFEIKRNTDQSGVYKAGLADKKPKYDTNASKS